MKKGLMLSALCGLGMIGAANAADITVYYSPSCPHCHHARGFIESTLIYEYPKLNVRNVDVTRPENNTMFREVLAKCEYESGGVPVLVIGEKCFQGYADFMEQDLRDAVEADMSDSDKETAANNRRAFQADADAFRAEHSDRAGAVIEYDAGAQNANTPATAQKKSSTVWFYGLLVVLVAALGFVLIRKDNKKK